MAVPIDGRVMHCSISVRHCASEVILSPTNVRLSVNRLREKFARDFRETL